MLGFFFQPWFRMCDSETHDYLVEIRRRRAEALARIRAIPLAALVWGPAPTANTPVALARRDLRAALQNRGYMANFSEDFYDPASPHSIQAQQVADVEAHDVVFSIPDSPGSIAEIHDFAKLPGVASKIVTFLDYAFLEGYASKSLIELRTRATADIVMYQAAELPQCIITQALQIMLRLQELQYMLGRRV